MHDYLITLIVMYRPDYLHVFYNNYVAKNVRKYYYPLYVEGFFELACKNNDLAMVKTTMKEHWWMRGYGAYFIMCKIGNVDLITDLITNHNYQHRRHYNEGLYGACYGGKNEVAAIMIDKGANQLNWGLHWACRGGHIETVNFIIEKGANWWDWGLYGACHTGQMDALYLMIKKGADDWDKSIMTALSNGHEDVANVLKEMKNKS